VDSRTLTHAEFEAVLARPIGKVLSEETALVLTLRPGAGVAFNHLCSGRKGKRCKLQNRLRMVGRRARQLDLRVLHIGDELHVIRRPELVA
jgi:hypothetical protein